VIIALFLVIKTLIALIKTYVYIILAIILAPLQIMLGVLPSIPFGGVWPWIKNLFANIVVFPAVAVVLVISSSIIMHSNDVLATMWYPPLIAPSPDIPILSDLFSIPVGMMLKSIIGLGILLLLPNIPDMVRSFLGVKDTGMGKMLGAGFGPVKSLAKIPAMMAVDQSVGAVAQRRPALFGAPGAPGAGPGGGRYRGTLESLQKRVQSLISG
ncbi:MAG: hypothetical protein ABID04_02855, partial [Patescibacteria group bacterium]